MPRFLVIFKDRTPHSYTELSKAEMSARLEQTFVWEWLTGEWTTIRDFRRG